MTIKKIFAVAAALAVLPLTGCRKDLCYDHNLHGTKVQVEIQPTWVQEWEDGSGNWQQNWNQSFGVRPSLRDCACSTMRRTARCVPTTLLRRAA